MNPYQRIEPYLKSVLKPARYIGGEYNQTIKEPRDVNLRAAFCFPDTYEIGMSCPGVRILYDLINRQPFVSCERAFAPWLDMQDLMRRLKIPLYALESGDALCDFDLLAFTIQTEFSYTNILTMLDLSNIPFRAAARGEQYPLIIGGGPCCYNPEPIADFFDLFVVGEGEEVFCELLELFNTAKLEKLPRAELLNRAAELQGVYVPSHYGITYNSDGTIAEIAGKPVAKRICQDLDSLPFPEKHIAASTEIVHDRIYLELFRGCARGCRFCQSGSTNRPVRQKSPGVLAEQAKAAVSSSGASEIGLVSLSTSDYSGLEELVEQLEPWCTPRRVSLSLPSLRADSFSPELLKKAGQVRKSGLTFAPEAGSRRLRDVINKNLSEEDLMAACATAFKGGWSGVKLYFMLGLPTETDEDLAEIAELCSRIYMLWRETNPDKGRSVRITASASCFTPKPHTPFQWEAMTSPDELLRKAKHIKKLMRRQVTFNWHEPDTSYLEGVLCRGDRRLSKAIEQAYRLGCRMDGWRECFSLELWRKAFEASGIDPDFYALRERKHDEILPWSHISCGVSEEHLKRERNKAYNAETSLDCRNNCEGCGVGCP